MTSKQIIFGSVCLGIWVCVYLLEMAAVWNREVGKALIWGRHGEENPNVMHLLKYFCHGIELFSWSFIFLFL